MANARIEELRLEMKAVGAKGCLIPTEDPHGSEYPPAHFGAREYVSGFTGSAGTLFVSEGFAGLWTDGRYFLQAERELEGSGIVLCKQRAAEIAKMWDFFAAEIGCGPLAVDARCISLAVARELEARGIAILNVDLAGRIWRDRPALPAGRAFNLGPELSGEGVQSKLERIRAQMGGASALVISALDDVAWTFNMRGSDVQYTPVVLAYAIVEPCAAYLFIDPEKARDVAPALSAAGVTLLPYEGIYGFIEKYGPDSLVMASPDKLNSLLAARLCARARLIEGEPVALMKCVKNEAELSCLRAAHVEDGVAMARFMRWAKTFSPGETEVSATQKLDELRLSIESCIELSFTTIVGYGPHAAIIHHHAAPETDLVLGKRGLLLADSGGQYPGATTDVTRTIALGETTPEERRSYTLVLEGMLALLRARFPEGTHGFTLDMLARKPLWDAGLNYAHGTGHGVGAMLCVHEEPVRINVYRFNDAPLAPGVVSSDEPGCYIEGNHGVRIENLVECVPLETTPFGRFLGLRPLTLAPIDTDPIDLSLLSPEGRATLNAYHAEVYAALAPRMRDDERVWLREYTRAV